MIQLPKALIRGSIGLFLISGISCSTPRLEKVQPVNELKREETPAEMADFVDKFRVEEFDVNAKPTSLAANTQNVSTPAPSAAINSEALSETTDLKGKGKKKKGKKGAVETAAAPLAPATQAAAPAAVSPGPTGFQFRVNRPEKDPIWVGEKLTYDGTYLGMVAGNIVMEVLPFKSVNQRKAYHLKGTAKSTSVFNMFYRADDMAESFLDYDGWFSHRFQLHIDESKQTRESIELYDHEKEESFWWDRWNHHKKGFMERKEKKKIDRYSVDTFSALYRFRNMPLEIGGMTKVGVISDGQAWEAEIYPLEYETMSTPMGKKKCIKVKVLTKFQGVLKQSGDTFAWVIDDPRRIIAQIEAKVRIGSVKLVLTDFQPGTPP